MEKPLRILQMIGSLNIGGSQSMIMNIYRTIDKSKIQFDFIVDHPNHLYYKSEIESMGGKIYEFPLFNGKNVFQIMKIWDEFFYSHKEYTILHSHVRSYASIYIPIAKRHGIKTIIHSHSTSNGIGIQSLMKKIMQYPLRYQADYFFGCSKEAGKWLFGKKIVNSKYYFMIQNAVDLNRYIISDEVRKKYRQNLEISESDIVLIHVGRFHQAKNHLFLLDVFCEYIKLHNNLVLLLVGDGDNKLEIEKKIAERSIGNRIRLLGSRQDIPELLKMADIFVFPSKWEGFPITVIEAQAAGMPCLISDKITDDINITDLIVKLPIDRGVKPWISALTTTNVAKKNVIVDIRRAGFDITISVKWITNFYERINTNE